MPESLEKFIPSLIFIAMFFLIHNLLLSVFRWIKNSFAKKRLRYDKKELKEVLASESLKQKIKRYNRFGIRESKQKYLFIGLNVFGIILMAVFAYLEYYLQAFMVALIYPFLLDLLIFFLTHNTIKEREKTFERILNLKKKKMGLLNNKSTPLNHGEEFEVVKWNENLVTPEKVRIFIPVTFDEIEKDSFVRAFSIAFGGKRKWVVDMQDKDYPGWNSAKGIATIVARPELPGLAPWSEHYVLNDKVAWSFFPIAIGVENGIVLENPKTGKKEHVLGYDVDGAQQKLAKKKGMIIGKEIVGSPHALIIGVTGGGKALDLDEEVWVYEKELDKNGNLLQ